MIKFKQKEYGFPWMAALTAGSMGLSMKQAGDAEKQNEEIAEQQKRDAAKTRASLEKLANSGASPEAKAQAASLFSDLRLYAAPGGVLKNLGGLAKDLWAHSGGGVKKAAAMGAGFAATGYLGNRLATSIKDSKEGNSDKNKSFLKKAALGAATVGGGILAARKGLLGKGAQTFMTSGKGGEVLKKTGNFLNENVSPIKIKEGGKPGVNLINSAFIAMPTVSYLAQRKSQGDMVESTQQQRQYGWFNPAGAWKAVSGAAKHLWKNPGQALSGGFNKVGNFFGMMGGKGGTSAVQSGFKKLEEMGIKSGNKYTQKLGRWGQEHKNLANVATGAAAMGVGAAAMGVEGKLVSKPLRSIDKDAYKIEDQENDKI